MSEETKEQRTARLNMVADSVRGGLFASSQDILDAMKQTNVPDGPACAMTGACMFLAELYEGMARATGADRQQFRKHMLDSVAAYYDGYCEMTVKDALAGKLPQ